MKRLLLAVVLLVLGPHRGLWAAVDPADRFLQAYFLIQEADQAEHASEWAKAHAKFTAALDILHELKAQSPDWNAHIIDFRLTYCTDHVTGLKSRLPAAPAPVPPAPVEPAVAPAPTPAAAPPDETEHLQKLTADLQQAQQKIHQLEDDRAELSAKLKTALREVTPTETNLRIEQLLEKNKDMAAQIAAAQQQIADLTARTAELQQLRTQVRDLTASRDDLSTKLKEALARTAASETNPRVEELLKKNQELTTQLAAAQTQLAKTGERTSEQATAPKLAELQAQLADSRAELERVRQELAATKQDLGRTRKDLETARTENRALQETYQQMAVKVAESAKNLEAAQVAGQKNDEIIRFLRKENQLLHQIVDQKQAAVTVPPAEVRPQIPELKGWQPRRRMARRVEPVPSRPTKVAAPPTMKESARSKLVAELTAPPVAAAPAASDAARPPQSPESSSTLSAPLAGVGAKATAVPRPDAPAALGPTTDKTRTLVEEARAALAMKDYDAAAAKYEAVLEAEPNNLLALSNLAVVRYQQGKLDDAEQSLRKAVALAPNDSESRSLLGIVYFRKGKLEEAFGELTRAVALNPRHAEAHNYLGITLSEKGWGAAAEQEIRRAIELNPQYADAHFNLAVLYANQRTPRYEMARHHYQRALDLGAQPDPALEATLKSAGNAPPRAGEPTKP